MREYSFLWCLLILVLLFGITSSWTTCHNKCCSIMIRSSAVVLSKTRRHHRLHTNRITPVARQMNARYPYLPVTERWKGANDLRYQLYPTTSTSLLSSAARDAATSTSSNTNTTATNDTDTSGQHYIFGYGSLMCPLSRQITNANLMNKYTIPVVIQQLERTWCARTTTGYTALGVQFVTPHKNDRHHNHTKRFCTGVLIGTINAVELKDLDRREASYNRFPVYVENISLHPF